MGDTGFRDRALRVIEVAFHGAHHVNKIEWHDGGTWGDWCEFTTHDFLATWDYEAMTSLVVAAHDQCVRAEVRPAMRVLRVFLGDRKRTSADSPMTEAHPTLEDHVAAIRHEIDRRELARRLGYVEPTSGREEGK